MIKHKNINNKIILHSETSGSWFCFYSMHYGCCIVHCWWSNVTCYPNSTVMQQCNLKAKSVVTESKLVFNNVPCQLITGFCSKQGKVQNSLPTDNNHKNSYENSKHKIICTSQKKMDLRNKLTCNIYMNPYPKDGDFLGVGVGEFFNTKELNN